MKIFITIFITIFLISSIASSIPIPNNNIAKFDIIRKNKIIGNAETIFEKINNKLIITTIIDIEVKLFFIPAYKFYQKSKEIWLNNEFIEFEGYTDFEDDREYYITGKNTGTNFKANGMDGDIILNKKIKPLNYWDKSMLNEKEVFDTQKGILRQIKVKKLENEILKINDYEIETEKYLFNASRHPKDLGPFPEYTIWYSKNNEL